MGTIKQYNVATTGPNAALLRKVTRVDRREAPGVLFLGGPAHPAAPAAAGAAAGLRVRNAMWKNAQALTGGGDETTLGSALVIGTEFTGAKGRIERTGKGGLHGLVSQAETFTNTGQQGAVLQLDSALRAYLHAHRTDQWYVSMWSRLTRAVPSGSYPSGAEPSLLELGAGSTSMDYILSLMTSVGMSRWNTRLGNGFDDGVNSDAAGSALGNAVVPVRRWGAGSGKPTVAQGSPWPRVGPSWGAYGGSYNIAALNGLQGKIPSFIFYELFIDNLTVSGRTYQEANALDHEAFASAFAAGGRYSSDTFTDPTTLP